MLPALATVLLALAPVPAQASGLVWLDDWSRALAVAQREQRPILLEFRTRWCSYCNMLEQETLAHPRVVEVARGFVRVRLDAGVARQATARYSPEAFPTLVVAAPDGRELARLLGFQEVARVESVLRVVRDDGPRISGWLARIERHPSDLVAREALGRTYLDLEMPVLAAVHLRAGLLAQPSDAAAPGAESDAARLQFLLARASSANRDFAQAVVILDTLLGRLPASPRAPACWLELARAHLGAGEGERARSAIDRLARDFPGSAEAEEARRLLP